MLSDAKAKKTASTLSARFVYDYMRHTKTNLSRIRDSMVKVGHMFHVFLEMTFARVPQANHVLLKERIERGVILRKEIVSERKKAAEVGVPSTSAAVKRASGASIGRKAKKPKLALEPEVR